MMIVIGDYAEWQLCECRRSFIAPTKNVQNLNSWFYESKTILNYLHLQKHQLSSVP